MTFTVAYREKSGAKVEVEVEAANRAECFAQCKARGIVPVSVKEGASQKRASRPLRGEASAPATGAPFGNGQDASCPSGDKPQSSIFNLKSLILCVAVLLVAILGGAWWFLVRPQAKPPADPPKDSKPMRAAKPQRPSAKPTPAIPTNIPAAKPAEASVTKARHDEPRGQTAADIMSLEGEAKTPEQVLYRKRLAAISNRVFKTASDQVLAMAVSAGTGPMPPIPVDAVSDAAFRKSLETPIEILDDDPPNVKALKESVAEARAEMARQLAKGYSVKEVLAEHQKLSAENREIRLKAERELREIAASGDAEGARRYANTVNVALQQMGIDPISADVPSAARQLRDEAMERRRAARQKNQQNEGKQK